MRILGIETSCDETSAAVITAKTGDTKVKLLSNVVASSISLHAKTGGIIPEVAAREQVKYIIPVIQQALRESNLYPPDIDAIAVTVGPGLIGSLLVGVETAKTLAFAWQKPIIPVNHLVGHIYANFVSEISNLKSQISKIEFPAIALVVSGGHTDLVLMKKHGSIKWLGGTRDDAAGEAFDKIGRLLGLPYPAGPMIAKLAQQGNPKTFNFPRPLIDSNDFDFSFSGLKTAVFNFLRHSGNPPAGGAFRIPTGSWTSLSTPSSRPRGQDDKWLYNICASVQQAIVDVLVAKTIKAAQKYKVKSILLGGGVAANDLLHTKLEVRSEQLEVKFFAPAKNLCTDNAAMIASAAFFNYKPLPWQKITANPSLHFDT